MLISDRWVGFFRPAPAHANRGQRKDANLRSLGGLFPTGPHPPSNFSRLALALGTDGTTVTERNKVRATLRGPPALGVPLFVTDLAAGRGGSPNDGHIAGSASPAESHRRITSRRASAAGARASIRDHRTGKPGSWFHPFDASLPLPSAILKSASGENLARGSAATHGGAGGDHIRACAFESRRTTWARSGSPQVHKGLQMNRSREWSFTCGRTARIPATIHTGLCQDRGDASALSEPQGRIRPAGPLSTKPGRTDDPRRWMVMR